MGGMEGAVHVHVHVLGSYISNLFFKENLFSRSQF